MKVIIVYAHPCKNSFTYKVKEEFVRGLCDGGCEVEISDLYAMNFKSEIAEQEYLREANYNVAIPVPEDVVAEQRKINDSDAVAFIYPVFWTEAPAKLVGWFQRVWTFGYAYGPMQSMRLLDKAMFLVTMGGNAQDENRKVQIEAMKTVMLGDRIADRAVNKQMFFFDEMTHDCHNEERERDFLKKAYELGLNFKNGGEVNEGSDC